MPRSRPPNDDDDISLSSSSSSTPTSSVVDGAINDNRKSKKRHKSSSVSSLKKSKKTNDRRKDKKKKVSKRKKSDRHDKDDDDDKHHKHDKKRRKKKHKRHRKYADSDDADDDDSDGASDSSTTSRQRRPDKKRRRTKESKKQKQRDDKSRKGISSSSAMAASSTTNKVDPRALALVRSLHNLLQDRPQFATELPLIFIRLAGGTTLDLRQMTDMTVALGLEAIFTALQPFGVTKEDHMWAFQAPSTQQLGSGRRQRDELVLLRVVRSFLSEVGITMDAVTKFEADKKDSLRQDEEKHVEDEPTHPILDQADRHDQREDLRKAMKERTLHFLSTFRSNDASLGQQLAGICAMIAKGESVSIDGLPDEKLKDGLAELFQACGLEKSEMDDDDDDDGDDEPVFGYGVPEDQSSGDVALRLAAIMEACREEPKQRRTIGPMRGTPEDLQYASTLPPVERNEEGSDEEEEEGPLLPGATARRARGPKLSSEMIKAQAKHRELQLKATAAGVDMPVTDAGGREEWILLPGKYDFLNGIKSGQPTKSRGFQNKKARSEEKPVATIHPAVQHELDKIMEAHDQARGPSLMDQHREKKNQQREAAARNGSGKGKNWRWNRDNDLDAGRRVDKDALGMILGGAADNLKTKFSGGFNP